MAEASELTQVRINTDTTNVEPWKDDYVNGLIDGIGVNGASAAIWRAKAATYSTSVDVTEAGASHKFSDLFKNAMKMAEQFDGIEDSELASVGRPRMNYIVRE